MEVDVYYDDWHVGDGDPAIRVGSRWTTTLLLLPIEVLPVEPDSQAVPRLTPTPERTPALTALQSESAGYEFVAETVLQGRPGWDGTPCSLLSVTNISFAVEAVCRGRVSGAGRLLHDTHRLDDEHLSSAATQSFKVTRVRFLEHVYRQVNRDDFRFVLEGYGPAVDVGTTHARSTPWPPPAAFLITVDTSTAGPSTGHAESVRPRPSRRTRQGWKRLTPSSPSSGSRGCSAARPPAARPIAAPRLLASHGRPGRSS